MENGNYGYIKPVLLRPRLLSGLSLHSQHCAGSELLTYLEFFLFRTFLEWIFSPDLCFLTSAKDNCMNYFAFKKLCQYFLIGHKLKKKKKAWNISKCYPNLVSSYKLEIVYLSPYYQWQYSLLYSLLVLGQFSSENSTLGEHISWRKLSQVMKQIALCS